jgi:hypothetical protein
MIFLVACSAADPCAGNDACVNLTVTSRASLSVDELRITAAGAVEGTRSAMTGNSVRLPVDVPIALPAGAGGVLDLYIEGWSRGSLAASGEIELDVNVGAHSHATVDIEPTIAATADLATPPSADLAGTVEAACADAVHSRCARLATCSPSLMLRAWGDEVSCEARNKLDCVTEVAAPGSGLTTSFVENCASAYAAQSCADRLAGFRPISCIVSGTRTNGQGCVYDSQCQSGFCKLGQGAACGACADATSAGSSCATNGDCSSRQSCAMGLCQSYVGLNGACSTAKPCGEELDCVNGTCKQQGASTGLACGGTQPACDFDRGLYCNSGGSCAIVAAATTQNPQCGVINGTRVVCTAGADCFSAVCKAPATDGAACDPTNGPTCRSPARCVTGLCRLPNPGACFM